MRTTIKYMSLLIFAIAASGCCTYHGVKPVYPDVGHPAYHLVEVDSLQPSLKWKANTEQTTYDLVVMEGPEQEGKIFSYYWKKMDLTVVYHREYLSGSEHRLEEPLKTSHIYFWAVKKSGAPDDDWSYYNYHLFTVFSYFYAPKQLYRFKTPNGVQPQTQ